MKEGDLGQQGAQKPHHHPFDIRRVGETNEQLTLEIKQENSQEVVIFTYTPPLETNVAYRFLQTEGMPTPSPVPITNAAPPETGLSPALPSKSSSPSKEIPLNQEDGEKDKPVRLHGRIGKDIENQRSPTGGIMAVFPLGEHPLIDKEDTFWASLPEDQRPALKKDTAWWTVAAFDERVQLLDGAKKGTDYYVTAYRRTWTQATGTQGKEKTIEGFYLLSIEPATAKTKKQQAAQQNKLLE